MAVLSSGFATRNAVSLSGMNASGSVSHLSSVPLSHMMSNFRSASEYGNEARPAACLPYGPAPGCNAASHALLDLQGRSSIPQSMSAQGAGEIHEFVLVEIGDNPVGHVRTIPMSQDGTDRRVHGGVHRPAGQATPALRRLPSAMLGGSRYSQAAPVARSAYLDPQRTVAPQDGQCARRAELTAPSVGAGLRNKSVRREVLKCVK